VDLWTRSCFSILHVLSFVYPSKYFQKVWTGGKTLKIIIKKNNLNLMYFNIIKCGLVDKNLSFYFMFSFFRVPSKIFSKSVDRWTCSEKSEKNYPNVFHYFELPTCQHEAVFLFHISFLSCTLQNVFKKCGQVDKFWKFWKNPILT
jgi:hypothetical protein